MVSTLNGGHSQEYKFLICGRTGCIGGLLGKLCTEQGINYEYGAGMLKNRAHKMF
jgi:hypothetical protein